MRGLMLKRREALVSLMRKRRRSSQRYGRVRRLREWTRTDMRMDRALAALPLRLLLSLMQAQRAAALLMLSSLSIS